MVCREGENNNDGAGVQHNYFQNIQNYHGNSTDDYCKVTEMIMKIIMIMWFAERESNNGASGAQ